MTPGMRRAMTCEEPVRAGDRHMWPILATEFTTMLLLNQDVGILFPWPSRAGAACARAGRAGAKRRACW